MACTPPITRKPGSLVLHYTHGTFERRVSFGLHNTVDLSDIPNLRTEAGNVASAMAGVMPDTVSIYAWELETIDGSHYYGEPFGGAQQGNHPTASGGIDYWSNTLKFSGQGNAPAPGTCVGAIHVMLHVGKAFVFIPGEKRRNLTADAGVTDFIDYLNSSTYLPADYFGQQVDLNPIAAVQFNAHTQKHDGT